MQEDESRLSQGFGSEDAEEGGSNTEKLKEELGKKAHQVADRARSAADRGKEKLTAGAQGVAGALRHASEGLRSDDQDELARYTGLVADKLEQLTGSLKNRDLQSLVSDVSRFAKQQPALFLGGAFTTGLLAARFLRSSAPKGTGSSQGVSERSGGGGAAMGDARGDDRLRDEVTAPDGFGPAPGGYGPAASPAGAFGGTGVFGADGAGGGPGNDAALTERKGAAE